MADPFQHQPQEAGETPAKAACRDQIEHLLAQAERVRNVSARDVAEVGARHGLNLGRQLAVARRELYRRFLEHCLLDFRFSPEENADILHLQKILHLPSWDAVEIHNEVVKRVYGRALEHVLEDGRLDPEEEEFNRRLREDLGIPLVTAEGMLQKAWRESHERSGGSTAAVPLRRFSGSSEASIEEAVQRALAEAAAASPSPQRLELVNVQIESRGGGPNVYHVALAPVAAEET